MKVVRLTVEMVLRVDDETAQSMQDAPGFITLDGVELGEDKRVGYMNEHEVEPLDVEIRVEKLSREQAAAFVAE